MKKSSKTKSCRNRNARSQRLLARTRKWAASDRRRYNPGYKGIRLREALVLECLRPLCRSLGLSKKTFYTSVAMADYVSSAYRLSPKKFSRLGLVCVRLASAISEPAGQVVSYDCLRQHFGNGDSEWSGLELELWVLTRLGFDLNFRSVYDYILLFMEDARLYGQIETGRLEEFVSWLSKLTFYCSVDYELNKYSALAVATGVVVAVRQAFGCAASLPECLEVLTGYTEGKVKACSHQVKMRLKKLVKNGKIGKNDGSGSWRVKKK